MEGNVFVRCVSGLSAFKLDALGDMPTPISCILSCKDTDSSVENVPFWKKLSLGFTASAISVPVTYALEVKVFTCQS